MKRVVVSGYRDYLDEQFVRRTLMDLLEPDLPYVEIITGECKTGVDAFAKKWAIDLGLAYKGMEADWTKHGKAAGPIRNEEMAVYLNQRQQDGDEVACICFIHPKSKGTKDMAKKSRDWYIDPIEIKINQPMSNCSNHRKDLFGRSDMKVVAEAIGGLHYEALSQLLFELQTKFHNDSMKDLEGKKFKVAHHLRRISNFMFEASIDGESLWQISKPFMDGEK